MAAKKIQKVVKFPSARKIILIKRSEHKLTQYERAAIHDAFPGEPLAFVRMDPAELTADIPAWHQHLEYCTKVLDKEKDVVVLPASTDIEQWAGITLMAVDAGYTHVYFGKDLELREITGVEIKSIKFKP